MDKDVVQAMRDELLFESYGGHVAVDAEGEESTDDGQEPKGTFKEDTKTSAATAAANSEEGDDEGEVERSDSYAIPSLDLPRQYLRVVDNWADHVERAAKRGTQEFERQLLRRDGELLVEAFQRQSKRDGKKGQAMAIGANLAAEELTVRLRHYPEA